ncbi:hypothetical protein PUV54_15075 [Hyphococcus flavus]|uniref:Uncharacterized protein n=1 Tax=Hyphococcus flavus TaxID=1866326 RepID=A0AAF0CBL6_9PROT|nr:hypothetical protein [Hyphococcus flavus]WDI31270.1 hypothetical protein PUV54_15075 [Hyphococcus flavus]
MKLTSVVIAAIISVWMSSCTAQPYVYTSLFDPPKSTVIDIEEEKMFTDHRVFSVLACKSDSQFICLLFSDGYPYFAVPRDGILETGLSWELNGATFQAIGTVEKPFFGTKVEGIVIDRLKDNSDQPSVRFIYSEQMGLLAFASIEFEATSGQGRKITYVMLSGERLLEGQKGFGARK